MFCDWCEPDVRHIKCVARPYSQAELCFRPVLAQFLLNFWLNAYFWAGTFRFYCDDWCFLVLVPWLVPGPDYLTCIWSCWSFHNGRSSTAAHVRIVYLSYLSVHGCVSPRTLPRRILSVVRLPRAHLYRRISYQVSLCIWTNSIHQVSNLCSCYQATLPDDHNLTVGPPSSLCRSSPGYL